MSIDIFTDNLDIVSGDPIRVRATISLVPEEKGGRHGPFTKGYRPNHNFSGPENSAFYIGEVVVGEDEWVYPGETREVSVRFLNARGLREMLVPGRSWRIQEGHRLVAEATVLADEEDTQQDKSSVRGKPRR
jgi:elongation factor Tu